MRERINVGIMGAGTIAHAMAEALKGIDEFATLYAIGSRTLEKAETFQQQWGAKKAYGSYEEMVLDDQIDLIYIATPHSEHYRNAMLCLTNGRNCLVEKAFCANATQAKKLIAVARKEQLLLAEAMWTRYQPVQEQIRALIRDGSIGTVKHLEAYFNVNSQKVQRMIRPELAGGALLDLGIYSLTVPVMYFGTELSRVRASVSKFSTGVDATTTVDLTYQDGRTAHTVCSARSNKPRNYAVIFGNQGRLEFGPINAPVYIKRFDAEGNCVEELDTRPGVNGYEYQVLECREALLQGQLETKSMPWSETIRMMNWMDSIRMHAGIVYPFETEADMTHTDEESFGMGVVYLEV